MKIQQAEIRDIERILHYDKHISYEELMNSVKLNRIYIVTENDEFCGWLRYGLFWDNTPFMNMLYFLEGKRKKGYGSKIVEYWENEMRKKGYSKVLTSTPSNETSQHFYSKLGYKTIGGFLLNNEPFEIIMLKNL